MPFGGFHFLASLAAALALAVASPRPVSAQDDDKKQETPEERKASREYLRSLTLEELLNVKITTASRKEETLSKVSSAVFVLRGDDLRRRGVRSIPEALRLIPGVNVARLNGSRWAVSARGFNDFSSNKLQVLLDGRSVYTHSFSGIVWNRHTTMIEDIDRIEVIRGPGGSTWGSNAINGVINIITKKSDQTQGALAYGGAGTERRDFAGARWGGKAAEGLHYRTWAMYFNEDEQYEGHDDWFQSRAGLRFDWSPDDRDSLMMTADVFDLDASAENRVALPLGGSQLVKSITTATGGHVLLAWEHRFSPDASANARLSYFGVDGESQLADEFREELQFEVGHRFRPDDLQEIQWGAGYRLFHDDIRGSFPLTLNPEEETEGFPYLYLQDELELIDDTAYLTLGSLFEYNDRTGFEYQPTVRLSVTPTDDHTFWAAASRAVRTPARSGQDLSLVVQSAPPPPFPTHIVQTGTRENSEELIALEAGWRTRPAEQLSFDFAGFYNIYDRLLTNEVGPTTLPPPTTVVPLLRGDELEGVTYGFEIASEWRPVEFWRLRGSYSFIRLQLDEEDGSTDTTTEVRIEGSTPRNQASLWSSLDVLEDFELDVVARYVDVLPQQDTDSYLEFDARLAWYPTENLELAIVGQNLARPHHEEFGTPSSGFIATEVERGFYFYVALRF